MAWATTLNNMRIIGKGCAYYHPDPASQGVVSGFRLAGRRVSAVQPEFELRCAGSDTFRPEATLEKPAESLAVDHNDGRTARAVFGAADERQCRNAAQAGVRAPARRFGQQVEQPTPGPAPRGRGDRPASRSARAVSARACLTAVLLRPLIPGSSLAGCGSREPCPPPR